MTYDLSTWWRHPKALEVSSRQLETEDYFQNTTVYTRITYKTERLKIPMTAAYHPDGLSRLTRDCSKPAVATALALVKGLRSATQKNIVEVGLTCLGITTSCSKPTTIKALKELEEKRFIKRLGKQTFYISPNLAWFGSQLNWAIALRKEETETEVGVESSTEALNDD